MTKKEKIKHIKTVIEKFGNFTTADVNANSSPFIGSLGSSTCQLAESFDKDKVEAIIYCNDSKEYSDYIVYEDLKSDVIDEIYELAKVWENIQTNEEYY